MNEFAEFAEKYGNEIAGEFASGTLVSSLAVQVFVYQWSLIWH